MTQTKYPTISQSKISDNLINLFVYLFSTLILIIMLYPFLNVLAISLNEPLDTIKGSSFIIPRKFTFFTYSQVLFDKDIYNATLMSLLRTFIGTSLNVFLCIIFGYILSRKNFVFRKPVTIMLVIIMYVNAGIIPNYFLIRSLGLLNNFLVYIIPNLISPFSVIVARAYIETISESLIESAKVDGCKEFTIIFKIIFPLVLPVMATITLFAAIFHWNSWIDTYLYAPKKQYLSTLQYELQKIMQSTTQSATSSGAAAAMARKAGRTVTPQSVKAAMTMIATIPIVCVYPFLQKYFITGLTIGGVKE